MAQEEAEAAVKEEAETAAVAALGVLPISFSPAITAQWAMEPVHSRQQGVISRLVCMHVARGQIKRKTEMIMTIYLRNDKDILPKKLRTAHVYRLLARNMKQQTE